MTQLTLGIDRLSNKNLSAFGYQMPSMDQQTERRFGALMLAKAKADKILRDPERGMPPKTGTHSALKVVMKKTRPDP